MSTYYETEKKFYDTCLQQPRITWDQLHALDKKTVMVVCERNNYDFFTVRELFDALNERFKDELDEVSMRNFFTEKLHTVAHTCELKELFDETYKVLFNESL